MKEKKRILGRSLTAYASNASIPTTTFSSEKDKDKNTFIEYHRIPKNLNENEHKNTRTVYHK